MQQEEILVKSSLDGSMQPSLLYRAEGKRPVLVGLHTWSFDRFNQAKVMPAWAEKYGFHDVDTPYFKSIGTNKDATRKIFLDFYGEDFPYDEYKKEHGPKLRLRTVLSVC